MQLDLPKALSMRVTNALKADPKSIDLRAQAQHFYALGCRMLELFEEDDMGDVLDDVDLLRSQNKTISIADLSQTFKKRAKEIDDQARNQRSILGEGSEFLRGLDEEERKRMRYSYYILQYLQLIL